MPARAAAVATGVVALVGAALAVVVVRDRDHPTPVVTVGGVTLEVVDPRGGEVDVSGAVDQTAGPASIAIIARSRAE